MAPLCRETNQGSPSSVQHDYATKLAVLNLLLMIVSLQHINNYTVILVQLLYSS